MKRKAGKYLSAIVAAFALWSCANSENGVAIYHVDKRDNIANVADMIVPIDNLPPLHSMTYMIIAGDTILYHDYKSTDLQFTAYDIYSEKTIGRFGIYGNGPGEIANYGFIFYDPKAKSIYGLNASQGKIMGFNVPAAVADSSFLVTDEYNWDISDYSNIFVAPFYINDTTVVCTTYDYSQDETTSRITKFNPVERSIKVIDSIAPDEKASGIATPSEKHNKIICPHLSEDMISIYDFDGKLLSRVYGPEYNDGEAPDNEIYFYNSRICDDKLASIYTGLNSKIPEESIIISDLDGKYIKTLKFGMPIRNIAYHEKTGRLYLSTDGEPQFGYIDFKKALSR